MNIKSTGRFFPFHCLFLLFSFVVDFIVSLNPMKYEKPPEYVFLFVYVFEEFKNYFPLISLKSLQIHFESSPPLQSTSDTFEKLVSCVLEVHVLIAADTYTDTHIRVIFYSFSI